MYETLKAYKYYVIF